MGLKITNNSFFTHRGVSMPTHKETWGFNCVDNWEKWYAKDVIAEEAKELNILRKKHNR